MNSPKKTPAELLFEIGCEEIPAGMLPKAEEDLRVNIEKLLAAEDLSKEATVETFSTPRRLTAWVRGLPYKQADVEFEVTGPPKTVAYDAVGAPTRAALSFAEKQRIHVSSLYLAQTPKGEYLAAKQVKAGRATEQILTAILPRAVHDLTWPRSMTWTGLEGPRFIRPIRWVVAVLDGKPLKLTVAGIAAGNATRGHRFLGSASIRVRNFLDYEKKLHANGVIGESDQRCRLADYLPQLERVTYECRLGSYRDKVERIRDSARWLTEQWFNLGVHQARVAEADRSAELAKCDLATEMVREFPELQGIVGGLYARAQGESDEIADAVYDHYRPVGLDDPLPRNLTGCAVALADKLDSGVGCLHGGSVPTGSSDPYALRRASL